MNRIINILMSRDGLTKREATSRVREYQKIRNEYLACGDIMSAMECIESELGLEQDYIMDLV